MTLQRFVLLLQVYSYGQTAHSLGSEPVVFETGGKSDQTRRVVEGRRRGWGRERVEAGTGVGAEVEGLAILCAGMSYG